VTRRRFAAVVAGVAVVLAACSSTDRGASSAGEVLVDQQFAPGLNADVHLPTGPDAQRPAVVLVHGGGFSFGQRQDMDGYASALADLGIVAMTVDYRLSPGNWFPAKNLDDPALGVAARKARDDTEAAVTWLHDNAGRLGVDPNRISVAGYSAGGITAVEVGMHDPAVNGAAAIAGAGIDLQEQDAGDAPMVLFHGTDDDVVPYALAVKTCTSAEQVGAPCELRPYEGLKHELATVKQSELVNRIAAFVKALPPRGG
jgi:acetyl esterase/lipase